jgi:hypothetical protein
MPIAFRCTCGKALKTRDELAGKKIQCPRCQRVLQVPLPGATAAEDCGPAATECPACGADLGPEAMVCVDCGLDLRTGRQHSTKHGRSHKVRRQHVEVAAWRNTVLLLPVGALASGLGLRLCVGLGLPPAFGTVPAGVVAAVFAAGPIFTYATRVAQFLDEKVKDCDDEDQCRRWRQVNWLLYGMLLPCILAVLLPLFLVTPGAVWEAFDPAPAGKRR